MWGLCIKYSGSSRLIKGFPSTGQKAASEATASRMHTAVVRRPVRFFSGAIFSGASGEPCSGIATGRERSKGDECSYSRSQCSEKPAESQTLYVFLTHDRPIMARTGNRWREHVVQVVVPIRAGIRRLIQAGAVGTPSLDTRGDSIYFKPVFSVDPAPGTGCNRHRAISCGEEFQMVGQTISHYK